MSTAALAVNNPSFRDFRCKETEKERLRSALPIILTKSLSVTVG